MNVSQILVDPEGFQDYRQIRISIGGDGKKYSGVHESFEPTEVKDFGSIVVLLFPDSVAEFYRQQGRRQLQTEIRELLNASRA